MFDWIAHSAAQAEEWEFACPSVTAEGVHVTPRTIGAERKRWVDATKRALGDDILVAIAGGAVAATVAAKVTAAALGWMAARLSQEAERLFGH
jgi:hypothetical protein